MKKRNRESRAPSFVKRLKIDIPSDSSGDITLCPFPSPGKECSEDLQLVEVLEGLGGAYIKGRDYAVSIRRGRRGKMQDTFCCLPSISEHPSNAFYGVFDGHGRDGHHAAQLSARCLAQYALSDKFLSNPTSSFQGAFRHTDATVLKHVSQGGTTATCVYLQQLPQGARKMWVANCGDSRCVLSRGGVAKDLSRDHTPGREDERRRIEGSGGRVIHLGRVWRVEGILNVSRSLGDKKLKPYISSEPEITSTFVQESDGFLILGTDGVFGAITSQDAVAIVQDTYTKGLSAAEASEALTLACKERGQFDNVCVIVVYLRPHASSPESSPDSASSSEHLAPKFMGATPSAIPGLSTLSRLLPPLSPCVQPQQSPPDVPPFPCSLSANSTIAAAS